MMIKPFYALSTVMAVMRFIVSVQMAYITKYTLSINSLLLVFEEGARVHKKQKYEKYQIDRNKGYHDFLCYLWDPHNFVDKDTNTDFQSSEYKYFEKMLLHFDIELSIHYYLLKLKI